MQYMMQHASHFSCQSSKLKRLVSNFAAAFVRQSNPPLPGTAMDSESITLASKESAAFGWWCSAVPMFRASTSIKIDGSDIQSCTTLDQKKTGGNALDVFKLEDADKPIPKIQLQPPALLLVGFLCFQGDNLIDGSSFDSTEWLWEFLQSVFPALIQWRAWVAILNFEWTSP